MRHKVTAVGRYPVPDGMELVAFTKTPRGTSVRSNTVLVLRGDRSKVEFKEAIALAVHGLMPKVSVVG